MGLTVGGEFPDKGASDQHLVHLLWDLLSTVWHIGDVLVRDYLSGDNVSLMVSSAAVYCCAISVSSSTDGSTIGEWHSRGDLKPAVSWKEAFF